MGCVARRLHSYGYAPSSRLAPGLPRRAILVRDFRSAVLEVPLGNRGELAGVALLLLHRLLVLELDVLVALDGGRVQVDQRAADGTLLLAHIQLVDVARQEAAGVEYDLVPLHVQHPAAARSIGREV